MAKKREEVAGRSPVITPRRPLTENKPLGSPAMRIGATDANTFVKPPAVAPVATQPQKSVFYEKFAKQASLQQKECFIELGEAKNALKPTPKKRELLENDEKDKAHFDKVKSDEVKLKKIAKDEVVNMDSPSVKVCTLS